MIVMSSDHGDYEVYEGMKVGKFGRRGIKPGVHARSRATLMVKPFGARGPLAMSRAQVSLRDIPHTILAANGLEPADAASPGSRDVFDVDETEDREREYLYYVWEHEYWSRDTLPPITTFRVTGDSGDPESWPDLKAR